MGGASGANVLTGASIVEGSFCGSSAVTFTASRSASVANQTRYDAVKQAQPHPVCSVTHARPPPTVTPLAPEGAETEGAKFSE